MAYYALHKLRILPGELMELPREERAFIYAAIDLRIKAEKEEEKKMKRKK
ncbi:hypothetical protein [Bacilliculturomica massiliensis]|nr:hypothetical protein [Bacilliculturomica massiliensis]